MDRDLIQQINRKVVKRFPEMQGVRPTMKREQTRSGLRFRLTYKGRVEIPGGRTMKRVTHVLVDERGKVLRMSTSK
ncbi:MAG: hypothetical protein PVI78_03545 [Anaerolineales bacterium]|jgi:hypothetical protein